MDTCRGGAQAPAGYLLGAAKVALIGVVLCAARHPGTRGGLHTVRRGTLAGIPPGSIPCGGRAHA